MAHFAKINSENTVEQVIVIDNSHAPDPFPVGEAQGQHFINNILGLPGVWLQTSYNSNFRGRYAGIGFVYDSELDQFVAPSANEDLNSNE